MLAHTAGAAHPYICHLPVKFGYLQVKVRRRLEGIGAVTVKNAVYVLPANKETLEEFERLVREITEGGGEAMVCEARRRSAPKNELRYAACASGFPRFLSSIALVQTGGNRRKACFRRLRSTCMTLKSPVSSPKRNLPSSQSGMAAFGSRAGICMATADDNERIVRGAAMFEDLYQYFRKKCR